MGRSPTFSRRSGLGEVLVIILVLMALLLFVPALVLYNQIAAKTKVHDELEARITYLNETVMVERIAQIREAIVPAGFDPKSEETDVTKIAEAATAAAENFRQGQGGDDVWKKFTEEFDADEADKPELTKRPATLQEMAVAMLPPADRVQIAERNSRTKANVAAKGLETANVIGPTIDDPYLEVQKSVAEDTRKVDEDQTTENAGFTAQKDLIDQSIAQKRLEKDEKELDIKRYEKVMNLEIGRLQVALDEFKRKELINFARITDVGDVFKTSADAKTVFLKLGSREGVIVGMRFRVGNKGLHGAVAPKGVIEVRAVFPEMAEAAVTHLENERNPIVAGDLLVNPFYHPRRPVVVRIVGREQASGTLSKTEAAGRIEAVGGVVRARFSPDLDFVIVTDENMGEAPPEDGEDLELARRLSVPVYSAKDMFEYLED